MIYAALLRGINVGGRNKINMRDLKLSFEQHGFKSVKTYINSGNIIFETREIKNKALEKQICKLINNYFKLNIDVLIRSYDQYREMMTGMPAVLRNDDNTKCDVLFLYDEIDAPTIINEIPYKEGIDNYNYINGAVLSILDRKNQSKSSLIKLTGLDIYKKMTVRNINTVKKIFEIMECLSNGS